MDLFFHPIVFLDELDGFINSGKGKGNGGIGSAVVDGDAGTGAATVILAMGAGKQAAKAIDSQIIDIFK